TITIMNTTGPVIVHSGRGAHKFILGDTLNHRLDGISANQVVLDAGSDADSGPDTATDSLLLDDSVGRSDITMSRTNILRTQIRVVEAPRMNVSYSGFESLDILSAAGSGAYVQGTAAGALTHIHTNNPSLVSVGDANNTLGGIAGGLDIIGAANSRFPP